MLRQNFIARKSFFLQVLQNFTTLTALYIMSSDYTIIYKLLPSLILLLTIINTINFIDNIFTNDEALGILDFYKSCYEIEVIIFAKYLTLLLFSILCLIVTTVISYIIFSLTLDLVFFIILGSVLALITSCIIFCIMGALSLYITNHLYIISSCIIPFIFPSLIVYSLFVQTNNIKFLMISLGINCIIVPLGFYLTKKLLEE
ncbi:MAG: hypothetical protein SFT68_01685 [Rickettsiaceae bacterium]|nr:hypothetical protein [Rickettsiaceae bacterium]